MDNEWIGMVKCDESRVGDALALAMSGRAGANHAPRRRIIITYVTAGSAKGCTVHVELRPMRCAECPGTRIVGEFTGAYTYCTLVNGLRGARSCCVT